MLKHELSAHTSPTTHTVSHTHTNKHYTHTHTHTHTHTSFPTTHTSHHLLTRKADLEKASKEFISNIADVREELRIGLERKLDLTPFEDKFRLGFGVAQGAVAQILAGKCDMDRAEHLCSSLADQIQQVQKYKYLRIY